MIEKSEGIKPDTYFDKAIITRTNVDYSTTTIPFNLIDQLNENVEPIFLKQDDVLSISSLNDLKEDDYVEISGEINNPGVYPYSTNLKLSDLLIIAGGVKNKATLKNIEISREKSSANSDFDKSAELLYVDLDSINSNSVELKPFDNIIVRKDPAIEVISYANIEGEVKNPGKYAI